MTSDTVTISKEEYEHLKELENIDYELVAEFKKSLENLKQKNSRNVRHFDFLCLIVLY